MLRGVPNSKEAEQAVLSAMFLSRSAQDMAFEMIGADDNLLRDFLVGSLCEDSRRTSYLYFHVADVLPIQNLMENMIWSLLNNQMNKRNSLARAAQGVFL